MAAARNSGLQRFPGRNSRHNLPVLEHIAVVLKKAYADISSLLRAIIKVAGINVRATAMQAI